MARNYEHISKYEKEIQELKSRGYIQKAIEKELGLYEIQVKNALYRIYAKQKKITAGEMLKQKADRQRIIK